MDSISRSNCLSTGSSNEPIMQSSAGEPATAGALESQQAECSNLDPKEESKKPVDNNTIASTAISVKKAHIQNDKIESAHMTNIGKQVLRLLTMLAAFFEAHDIDDIDDLEEALDDPDPFGLVEHDEPSVADETSPEIEEHQNEPEILPQTPEPAAKEPIAKERQIGPRLKAEIYRYFRNKDGNWTPKLDTVLDGTAQIVVDESTEPNSEATSTFEVTTMYAKKTKSHGAFSDVNKNGSKIKVLAHVETYMTIHSEPILNAIREVIEYYPMLSYRYQSPLVIIQPFCILLHYKDELKEYVNNKVSEATGLNSSTGDEVSHLLPLIDYLSEKYDSAIAEEKKRWQKTRPTCTFEWLWLLFRPGSTVVSLKDGILVAHTILSHNKERKFDGRGRVRAPEVGFGPLKFVDLPFPLVLKMWSLDFDGKIVGRREETVIIPRFDGEKALDTLPVIPISHWKDTTNNLSKEQLQKRLIERGKAFIHYTTRGYYEYSGKAISWPHRTIHGRIMVDTELRYSESVVGGDTIKRPRLGINEDLDHIDSITIGARPLHRRSGDTDDDRDEQGFRAKFTHPDDQIDISKATTLSDRQYMICNSGVWAFVTKFRQWELLDVENIKPVRTQENLIDDLVLEENAKAMIKALARSYTTERESANQKPGRWTADFIQNKGDGQIFLLHGKPGVGKTTTAECVAELTKRPLLSLTCGDLGTEPKEVESHLMAWLRIGTVWEAILLLDEADVYLESRRAQDLQRNSLVSIFLRALEYYQGILFLTSNRVGSFDDAFISRINVIIHYPSFLPEQRQQIWSVFFRKLEKERPNIRITSSVYDYVENDEQLKQLEWNGREIRNAFNTAVALAEFENDTIDLHGQSMINFHRRHLDQVVKMSKAFRKYLIDTHGADEAKRARLERIRND